MFHPIFSIILEWLSWNRYFHVTNCLQKYTELRGNKNKNNNNSNNNNATSASTRSRSCCQFDISSSLTIGILAGWGGSKVAVTFSSIIIPFAHPPPTKHNPQPLTPPDIAITLTRFVDLLELPKAFQFLSPRIELRFFVPAMC